MEVIVNGATEAGDFATVSALLKAQGLDPKLVVVELNGKILPAADWDSRQLENGDSLEIVQFVAGG
ncbi:MAG: sulfur carrier protein ThiS [Desulfovibrio sp.]|nr:sulfur carrier protein ThiS [Desulfovibrio sp.]